MGAELQTELRYEGSARRLLVAGEIDLSNVDRFEREMAAGEDDGLVLVVDLDGVTYMDSAGVAALFARARRGSLRVVARPDSVVAPLLRITRLADLAPIEPA